MNECRDQEHMALAIREAARGRYTTRPNPNVGCVITDKNHQIIATGFHAKAGQPHAEVHALQYAGEQARGGTAYVTLEPCCHQGRTPPCVNALIAAGIQRVVCASEDPNPQVAGKGIQALRDAGIEVQTGVAKESAERLNRGFLKRMRFQRPWLTSKSAMSLDGCTAMANGESKWITSQEARQDVQELRARHAAIMTGIGTVLHDDPAMTVRHFANNQPLPDQFEQPLRIVLDTRLEIPLDAKILLGAGECILYTHADSSHAKMAPLEQLGVIVVPVGENTESRISLDAVLLDLAKREINDVLLEAGPTLIGSALSECLIDQMIIYMAPHIMGSNGRRLFNLNSIEKMSDRIPLNVTDRRLVGVDMRLTIDF